MLKNKIEELAGKHKNNSNKRKIENIVFLIIILIITIIIINTIISTNKSDKSETNYQENTNINQDEGEKILATTTNYSSSNLESGLEEILSMIKGVGQVKVFINYSESSKTIAMYDETTTTSSTEENDSSGGTRNTTETENKKDVIYSEQGGNKTPITEKTVMPTISGAIVTAEGAYDANIKSSIINAVEAVTGLTIDKIQVFEMK